MFRAISVPACVVAWTFASANTGNHACADHSQPPPLKLSHRPQLFLDDYLIAHTKNIRRDVKSPTKHTANPLIKPDQPWERRIIEFYGTVLFDADTQLFRCWYVASESKDAKPEYYICYAESKDGIRWQKPMVGEEPFGPYRKHNVVIRGGHGISVIKEPDDPDAGRRYKAVGGDICAWSADGIHWTTKNIREPIGKNDTCPSVVRWKDEYLYFVRNQEPETGSQVADPRTGVPWSGTMRGVGLSTSKEFLEWTKKRSILRTDERDGYPWVQPHALGVTAYGDVLIGLLSVLRIIPAEGNNIMGTLDVQLAVSHDGREWSRVGDRAVFMPCDKPAPTFQRKWDARFHPGGTMLLKDDVVSIYYFGTPILFGEGSWNEGDLRFGDSSGYSRPVVTSKSKARPYGIGLATLPADRFVSLQPVNWLAEAEVRTRPLIIEGRQLVVNAELAPESLQVSLLDENGKPLQGFAGKDSIAVPHDKLRKRIVWRVGGREKTLRDAPRDKPFAIEFRFHDGELYAFQALN